MTTTSVAIHVDALEGPIPARSDLRVRLVDSTALGEMPVEIASTVIPNWSGRAESLALHAPSLAPNRDYTVLAHAGPTGEISVGDWITMDNCVVVRRTAYVRLGRVEPEAGT